MPLPCHSKTGLALLLALALYSPLPSHARDGIAPDFTRAGQKIPAALERMGYSDFGRLSLASLRAHIPAIPVAESKEVAGMNSQGRVSAHWQCGNAGCSISVNPAWWKKFPDQQPILALHEYLGAEGFYDDNYWISTSLWFLSLPEAQAALSRDTKSEIAAWIAKNAAVSLPRGTRLAGGVVGVGGGGESASLWARMRILKDQLAALRNPRSSEEEKAYALGQISHYLSSELAVMWGR